MARPPQTERLPRYGPLSRLMGATPTRLAICVRFSLPNSGRYASSVRDTCGSTPDTLRNRSSFSRKAGLHCILCRRSVSRLSSSYFSQSICASVLGCTSVAARPRRFLSATRLSITCHLRSSTAPSACVSASRRGLIGGRTASPKCARI